jgi:hypothetical protein
MSILNLDNHNDNAHDLVGNEGDNQPALLEPPPINQQDDDANINEDEARNQDEDDGAEPNEELEVNLEDEVDELETASELGHTIYGAQAQRLQPSTCHTRRHGNDPAQYETRIKGIR